MTKSVIEALNEAAQQRSEISTIISQTNRLSSLSNAFHSFGDAYEDIKDRYERQTILDVLNPLLVDSDNMYEGTDKKLSNLHFEAKMLIQSAQRVNVQVVFEELLDTYHEDVEYISSWSSSSLYC